MGGRAHSGLDGLCEKHTLAGPLKRPPQGRPEYVSPHNMTLQLFFPMVILRGVSITAYYCTLSLLPITFKLRDNGFLVTRVPLPVLFEMLPRGRIAACSEVQVLYSLIVFVGEFLLFDSFLIVKLQICKYISNPVMLQISLIDIARRSTS